IEAVGGDQIGAVGNDRIDVADQAQPLVKIWDVDAHAPADQLHKVDQLERDLWLVSDQLAMAGMEDRCDSVMPASAAARNSRSRNSALNSGRTDRWLACVLRIGTSRSTSSSCGIARSTCLIAAITRLGRAQGRPPR